MSLNRKELETIFNELLEALRLIALSVFPFMPDKAQVMWEALGFRKPLAKVTNLKEVLKWGVFPAANEIKQPPHLFPRLDSKRP